MTPKEYCATEYLLILILIFLSLFFNCLNGEKGPETWKIEWISSFTKREERMNAKIIE